MDGAYEDDETRRVAQQQGLIPVVPSNPRRAKPIPHDLCLYRQRNQIERLFRRLKAWRRVFTRYDKLDWMFAAFITVALVAESLR